MNTRRVSWLLLAALPGCGSNGIAPDIGAIRTSVTPESQAELEQVLTSATGNTVTIAEDALTDGSFLTLERRRNQAIDRPPEPGRDLGMPLHFQLVIDGRQCFLVDQGSGLRWLLSSTTCEAESQ